MGLFRTCIGVHPSSSIMGVSRDSMHKRRATGGKRKSIRKKRKFELGRPAALTKLGPKRIHDVRGRHIKHRALRLDAGNFSWGSEALARKTRILTVVYNASSNELVRTNTLVKSAIVQIDTTPFRQWYKTHYGVELGKKRGKQNEEVKEEEAVKESKHLQKTKAKRAAANKIDSHLLEQFNSGRLLAKISSRSGQSGRADGYILEGPELEFYARKLHRKKKN